MIDEESPSYLADVADRLRDIVGPVRWSVDRAIALGHILHLYEIECVDGFLINGDSDESILGYSDVAKILAHICDAPVRTWQEWHRTLPSAAEVSPNYQNEMTLLVEQIRKSPHVRKFVTGDQTR